MVAEGLKLWRKGSFLWSFPSPKRPKPGDLHPVVEGPEGFFSRLRDENGVDVARSWGGSAEETAPGPPRRPPRLQRPGLLKGTDGSDELTAGRDRPDGPPEAGAEARLPPSFFKDG
ncbi:uncharacterized protein LOC116194255 isoform X2 [Punica granatum]|uniref:Uncharacterized protein LOC116194255 isoform X2 n=1 Tax=Punica granatum TaxID=22663 RepID=A0A6P8C8V3_PUNGR|nr:uncharacterized protein LOC116194255 isoform X2 [Punica granatum]